MAVFTAAFSLRSQHDGVLTSAAPAGDWCSRCKTFTERGQPMQWLAAACDGGVVFPACEGCCDGRSHPFKGAYLRVGLALLLAVAAGAGRRSQRKDTPSRRPAVGLYGCMAACGRTAECVTLPLQHIKPRPHDLRVVRGGLYCNECGSFRFAFGYCCNVCSCFYL